MRDKTITGYCDPFSVETGGTVRFMVSTYAPGGYRASLVRIRSGERGPDGGMIYDDVPSTFEGEHAGRHQPVRTGSYAVTGAVPDPDPSNGVTLAAWIWPTRPGNGVQTIIGCGDGICLNLDETGAAALQIAGQTISTGAPLRPRYWYRVSASYDPASGEVTISQQPQSLSPGQAVSVHAAVRIAALQDAAPIRSSDQPVTIAARISNGEAVAHFNGKIDRPRMAGRALDAAGIDRLLSAEPDAALRDELLGHWDFSRDIDTQSVTDLGPRGLHGTLVNIPTRAMTGHNWDGSTHNWQERPGQYGAIHFHDDDLYDAGWEADFSFEVPTDLPSGLYAARLEHGEDVDYIPFAVRPPLGTATAPVAFLVPTASYLAYANYRLRLKANPIFGDGRPNNANDAFLGTHPEMGNSTYDLHNDRSGVAIASRLRPVTNMKPVDNRLWGLPADCNIIGWLEHAGQAYDVITDEDLHTHGDALLKPYRAVITGSHPEYHSTAMLDGFEAWLGQGGRLMYMGGNGFYWRVAFHDDLPGVLEVRRAEDGTRAWIAEPGEYYHAFNGEYGGLWRRIGRAPNRLVGVGFAAQGFDKSGYYRRMPGADDPRAAFIFEGIRADVVGNTGLLGGGAAGEEIDRCDGRLGSPAHALVVATSEDLGPDMLRTKEEFLSTIPPFDDPKVRADMTFFECPNGGAVFSTGSIAYASALPVNGFDNDLAKLTTNVVRRFADPAPFEMPGETG
ncbi:MAG: N,N-dimethylformamidase beta subunit family domain-containing protein [Minwuia sp.]|uniref:N,N-dimethylformamidase beta subunit family domain-containing protein n=1 Tax=Minwuia sp. TaxID=2493630 RepID=UPI003A86F458